MLCANSEMSLEPLVQAFIMFVLLKLETGLPVIPGTQSVAGWTSRYHLLYFHDSVTTERKLIIYRHFFSEDVTPISLGDYTRRSWHRT